MIKSTTRSSSSVNAEIRDNLLRLGIETSDENRRSVIVMA
jgi:hypothetical protein